MELDLFMGEQSLIFNVKGKGLVVCLILCPCRDRQHSKTRSENDWNR